MSQELIKEIKEKQEEIKDKVSKLRVVKAGDYVLAEDHNSIVEILKDLNTLLDKIIEAIPPPVKVLSPILLSPRSLEQTELLVLNILEGIVGKEETSLQEYMIEGQPESEAPFETIKSTTTAETSKILGLSLTKLKLLLSLKDLLMINVYSKTVWEVIIEYLKIYVTKPKYNIVKSLYDTSLYLIEGKIETEEEYTTIKPETVAEKLECISVDETVKQTVKPYTHIKTLKVSATATYESKMKTKTIIETIIEGKPETEEKYTTLKPTTILVEAEALSLKTPYTVKTEYKGVYRSGEGMPAKEKEEKTIEVKKVVW